ncbi:MAG: hypothetical protein ACLTUR_16255 [Paraclostridium sordellii]
MLKQVISELKCFERKINNLEESIYTEDLNQIEIEFSNIKNEFEALQEAIYGASEDLKDIDYTMFNVERFLPITIVIS